MKARAVREDASVNALVLRLIEQGLGLQRAKGVLQRHDDLSSLAGTWREEVAAAFGALLGSFAVGTREARNRSELSRFLESSRVEELAMDV